MLQAERLDALMVISAEIPRLEEFPFERFVEIEGREITNSPRQNPGIKLERNIERLSPGGSTATLRML